MDPGRKIQNSRLLRALVLALALSATLCWLRLNDPSPVASLRASGFDFLQQLWPRAQISETVAIVDVDEASLAQIGQWPWSRDKLAKIVDNLNALGAKVIAFDMIFPEADQQSPSTVFKRPEFAEQRKSLNAELPDTDAQFVAAIKRANVVAAAAQTNSPQVSVPITKGGFNIRGSATPLAAPIVSGIISNLPEINDAAKGIGLFNLDLATESGVARTVPMLWSNGKSLLPSLDLEILRVSQNENSYLVNGAQNVGEALESITIGKLEIPTNEHGLFQIYYRPQQSQSYISASELLNTKLDNSLQSKLSGKIVLIGTSAAGLGDRRISSLGETIPGVSIHAQAIEQILGRQFLTRGEVVTQLELIYVVAAGLIIAVLSIFIGPAALLAGWAASVALTLYGATLAFRNYGLLYDATFPLLASALLFLGLLAMKLLVTERQGRSLRFAFSHYLSPPLLREIERNPKALKLGGEQRDVTIMFVDIKNFTPMTEKLTPQDLVSLVNQVLSLCTTAILRENGTLDKYIGDAVMAIWNAPLDISHHQYHAAVAALKIQENLAALNKQTEVVNMLNQAKLPPIGLRIGIATGLATVGNMGSAQRFDYSALGEPVNMAARAEQACKQVNADIVIAGELRDKSQTLSCLDAGKLSFKGQNNKVQCHAVFAASRDEAHKQADMALYGFQSGTRLLQPKLAARYTAFVAGLSDRRSDYGLKN